MAMKNYIISILVFISASSYISAQNQKGLFINLSGGGILTHPAFSFQPPMAKKYVLTCGGGINLLYKNYQNEYSLGFEYDVLEYRFEGEYSLYPGNEVSSYYTYSLKLIPFMYRYYFSESKLSFSLGFGASLGLIDKMNYEFLFVSKQLFSKSSATVFARISQGFSYQISDRVTCFINTELNKAFIPLTRNDGGYTQKNYLGYGKLTMGLSFKIYNLKS
jgi:hypothetical protein